MKRWLIAIISLLVIAEATPVHAWRPGSRFYRGQRYSGYHHSRNLVNGRQDCPAVSERYTRVVKDKGKVIRESYIRSSRFESYTKWTDRNGTKSIEKYRNYNAWGPARGQYIIGLHGHRFRVGY